MKETERYYVVKEKAVGEVLLKVVEAKRLMERDSTMTVQQAADAVGISRSSYYKYKDDIFPFHDNAHGRTVTFVLQMDDVPGLLSEVLQLIAKYEANILTIQQAVPENRVALVTLSIEVYPEKGDITVLFDNMRQLEGIHYLKILARE